LTPDNWEGLEPEEKASQEIDQQSLGAIRGRDGICMRGGYVLAKKRLNKEQKKRGNE